MSFKSGVVQKWRKWFFRHVKKNKERKDNRKIIRNH